MRHAGGKPAVEMSPAQIRVFRKRSLLACFFLLISVAQLPVCAQTTAGEYQIKAAFLFHFAQFVSWPPGALDAGQQVINLCVFADEPHRQELEDTIQGKLVDGRVLQIRLLGQTAEIQGCNILFLSRDEARRQAAILKSLRGLPVLTVGETDSFLSNGGMICFHFEDSRIRFDVNLGAAQSARLAISSRLLLLATSVMRGGGSGQAR